MPMNEHNTSRHSAPQPMCAALEPLLPLLSLGKLEPDETEQVREHVATCGFCQSQLDEFDTVRDGAAPLRWICWYIRGGSAFGDHPGCR